jgi:hypothetical protein
VLNFVFRPVVWILSAVWSLVTALLFASFVLALAFGPLAIAAYVWHTGIHFSLWYWVGSLVFWPVLSLSMLSTAMTGRVSNLNVVTNVDLYANQSSSPVKQTQINDTLPAVM